MTWPTGKLTELRAQQLWLVGASTLNGLADSLKSQLLGTGRQSGLSLLDSQRSEIEQGLTSLVFDIWLKQGQVPLDPVSGDAYTVFPEAEQKYIAEVNRWVTDAWNEAVQRIEGGGTATDWKVSAWFVESEILRRRYALRARAGLWALGDLVEIVMSPALRTYSDALRARIGDGMTGAEWVTFEGALYQTALADVEARGRGWLSGEKGMPAAFYTIKKRVEDAGAATYKSGTFYAPLQMSPADASAILRELDEMASRVPEKNAGEFAFVYNAIENYLAQMGGGLVKPEDARAYPREVATSDRLLGVLLGEVGKRWEFKQWVRVNEEAGKKGLEGQLEAMITAEREAIDSAVSGANEDPWSGPLTRAANGATVPFAGIPVGESLYLGWIDGLVDGAYDRIYEWVMNASAVTRTDEYVVDASYVESLTVMMRRLWYGDVARGVREIPDSLGASVRDRYWLDVETGLLAYVGRRTSTLDGFQEAIWAFYMGKRAEALGVASSMLGGTGKEWPERFVEIEAALDGGVATPGEASSLLMELDGMRGAIPSGGISRFDAAYGKALSVVQALAGGVYTVVWRKDTRDFYDARVAEFERETGDDSLLANEMGFNYREASDAFGAALWKVLEEVEGRSDLTERVVDTQRGVGVTEAWESYATWRQGLYDALKPVMESVTWRSENAQTNAIDVAWVRRMLEIDHSYMREWLQSIKWIVESQPVEVTGGLEPFVRFRPLKSVSGFDMEEYSMAHMDKVFTNWATPERLARGISCAPKINGYRLIVESKGGRGRIYMEGATKDYAPTYTNLAAAVSGLGDVILDGELVEEMAGEVGERSQLAKYRVVGANDENAVVHVFDILYLEGKGSLTELPQSERRALLEAFMAEHASKRLRLLPERVVHTEAELRAAAEWADAFPGSEGCMCKTVDSLYLIGKRTPEWCLLPETLILTPDGTRELRSLRVGDQVFGESGPVCVVGKVEQEAEKVVRVVTMLPDLVATPGHRFLTVRLGSKKRRRIADREERKDRRRAAGIAARPTAGYTAGKWEPEWVEAAELEVGDYLVVAEPRWSNSASIGEDKAYLYGWGVAEGYPNDRRQQSQFIIALGRGARKHSEELASIVERYWPVTISHLHEGTRKEQHKMYLRDSRFAHWWVENFGADSHTKRIPAWVFGLPKGERVAFLRGAILGDGSKMGQGLQYTTCSRELAYGMFSLSVTLGYVPMLHVYSGGGACYCLVWSSDIGDVLPDLCTRQCATGRLKANGWYRGPDGRLCVRVRKIRVEGYAGTVVHIETEDGTFAPLVVSHNSKIKRTADLQVRVLGVVKTKVGDWVPRCGVAYDGRTKVDPAEIETIGTQKYVVLGNSFRTKLPVKVGDVLEVSVTEVVQQEGPRGLQVNWMLPKVKDYSGKVVDSLAYAQEVGKLLTGSDDLSWGKIREIESDAVTATTMGELGALETGIWSILSDLNAARLRAYAWSVLQLIRGRLWKTVDSRVGSLENAPGGKLYEIGVEPNVTLQMVEEFEAQWRGIQETVDEDGAARLDKARALLTIVTNVMHANTDVTLEVRLSALEVELSDFVKTVEPASRSILDITADIAKIEGELDDLRQRPTEDIEQRVAEYVGRLNGLSDELGSGDDDLRTRIEEVTGSLDEWMNPPYKTAQIMQDLNAFDMEVGRAQSLASRRDLSGKRIVEMLPQKIAMLRVRMRPWQVTLFGDRMEAIEAACKANLRIFKDLEAGTLTGALARSTKLDLGCGENKPEGYFGIDKEPLRGVDRVWDLENGIPFADDTFSEVRANHILEHLGDPVAIMSEIWRVLRDGGVLVFEVPSTSGEGAFANLDHKSNWNKLSFAFYEDDELRKSAGVPVKFKTLSIEETKDPESGAVYVKGKLAADKKGLTQELQAAAKLTAKGEQSGVGRTNFMQEEPEKIPVPGTLWLHVKGIDPEHRDWSLDQLLKGGEVLSIHGDLRFNWRPNYLEGLTLFLGNAEDAEKLTKYQGGKLGCTIKARQPVIWSDPAALDGRLFPPGGVGNVAGAESWGKMFLLDRVEMVPSRMRGGPKGRRYWEFRLTFSKLKALDGLWAMSEEAAKGTEIPFYLFKLKTDVPFWGRGGARHRVEVRGMPTWQKPE